MLGDTHLSKIYLDNLQCKAQQIFNKACGSQHQKSSWNWQARIQDFLLVNQGKPTTNSLLMYIATEKIHTIKVYFSVVHYSCVLAGMFSKFSQQLTPRAQLALRGIQWMQAISQLSQACLPVILQLLQNIHDTYLISLTATATSLCGYIAKMEE